MFLIIFISPLINILNGLCGLIWLQLLLLLKTADGDWLVCECAHAYLMNPQINGRIWIFFMLDNVNLSHTSTCVIFPCLFVHHLLNNEVLYTLQTDNGPELFKHDCAPNTTSIAFGQRVEMRLRGNGLFRSGFPGCSTAISLICGFISMRRTSLCATQQSPSVRWPGTLLLYNTKHSSLDVHWGKTGVRLTFSTKLQVNFTNNLKNKSCFCFIYLKKSTT